MNDNNYKSVFEVLIHTKNWIYQEQRFKLRQNKTFYNKSNDQNKKLETPLANLQEQVRNCTKCSLAKTRRQVVFGIGNSKSSLMLVGEAPGHDEDVKGLPFVGQAGQLLDKMLKAININREDIFICNVIKCRPPNNRTPYESEISFCSYYLDKQIEIINPDIIFTMGNIATQYILKIKTGISRLRGKRYNLDSRIILPSYHPSALLHNSDLKRHAWNDLKLLKLLLQRL